jgi:hypothetical protein
MRRLFITAIISMAAAIAANAQSTAPYWLVGTWKGGENTYIFSDTKVTTYTKTLRDLSIGKFEIDYPFLVTTFNNGYEESFLIFPDSQSLCYEGGDYLHKVQDPQLAWLYGKWETPNTPKDDSYYACVIITPQYTQTYCAMWDEEGMTIEQMPKNKIQVGMDTESIDDTYIIDHDRKAIYWLFDFDIEMHLEKVD